MQDEKKILKKQKKSLKKLNEKYNKIVRKSICLVTRIQNTH